MPPSVRHTALRTARPAESPSPPLRILPRRRPGGGSAAARRAPVTFGLDVAAVLAAFPDLAGFAQLPASNRLQSLLPSD